MYAENLHEHAARVCTMWHLLIECFLRNAFIIYEEIESVSNTRTHPCTLQHTALPAPVSVNVSKEAECSRRMEMQGILFKQDGFLCF